MAKKSTLISKNSFIVCESKNMKENAERENGPSEAIIQNILNFSKALCIRQSQKIGLVEFMLN